jgi:hypothetical protein
MTVFSENNYNLRTVSGELYVLAIAVFGMIIVICLNFIAIFRLIGVSDIPQILMVSYRALDLLIIATFFCYCQPKVQVRFDDLALLVFITYPFLIGFGIGNLSITFVNDAAIYLCFVFKIVILRTVLTQIGDVVDLDTIFRRHARRIIFFSAMIAMVSLGTVGLLLRGGAQFYFQAPAELTFAAALALAQGNLMIYFVLLVLALASGKRMMMIGVLAIGAIAILSKQQARKALLRLVSVGIVLTTVVLTLTPHIISTDFLPFNKILGTFRIVSRAMENSVDVLDMFKLIDPGRYVEYVSLKPHLTGWSLWFGNGYGFRYELNSSFLAEFGYEAYGDATNAHFTPLGITAKFGIVGLAIWVLLMLRVILRPINKRSYFQVACRLAFISMLVQSLFAFGFFISVFTPFYIAAVTLGLRRSHTVKG